MSTFKHLSINELIHMTTDSNDVQIVDIRDGATFNAGHIENSINLTNENIAQFIADADMDKPLVVVCYHGISSQGAAGYLIEQGFDDVYSLDGGYVAWGAAHA
ncbi:thiosulfate sulfurtransferase GlpE [Shewanella sp. HL-SH8]|uniref:thiosulfate sulfurtransferase GlpE n=1 Tax=unclassified Shewanella TaxID=196818 RepID=UPI003EBFC643